MKRGEGHTLYTSSPFLHPHLGGVDYVPGVYTISFPAGTRNGSTQCVQIPLIDDTLFEKTEYFECHFVPVDPDCDFHIYGHPYVSVHIYDDERKYLMLDCLSLEKASCTNYCFILQRYICNSHNMTTLSMRMSRQLKCAQNYLVLRCQQLLEFRWG